MKSFKSLLESQMGVKNAEKKDTDDEVKDFKPRSKGEEDFANMHKGQKPIDHPVAGENQFKGGKIAAKGESGEDHDGYSKPGQKLEKKKSFKQFAKEEVVSEDWKKQNSYYHKEAIKQLKRALDALNSFDANSSSKYMARQFQDIADELENSKEFQDNMPKTVSEDIEFIEEGQGVYRKGNKVGGGHKLSQEEANVLDAARKGLNPQNAKKFDSEVMKSKESFESILTFAKASA